MKNRSACSCCDFAMESKRIVSGNLWSVVGVRVIEVVEDYIYQILCRFYPHGRSYCMTCFVINIFVNSALIILHCSFQPSPQRRKKTRKLNIQKILPPPHTHRSINKLVIPVENIFTMKSEEKSLVNICNQKNNSFLILNYH